MKHKEEILRWDNCPDDTQVWSREINAQKGWGKVSAPFWSERKVYVVDDKYAELRKAQADGATILFLGEEIGNLNFDNELENYSIKEKRASDHPR